MSIKITQAAIEAGAIALQRIFPNEFVHSKAKELAYAVLYWANEHLQPDCKVSPQTVQSPPATATQVAIDDEEERVARAMWESQDRWSKWEEVQTKEPYLIEARAAIRAIREGGQRWGVWCVDPGRVRGGSWEPLGHSRSLSCTDKALVLAEREAYEEKFEAYRFEVRPYPGERAKTAEEIAIGELQDIADNGLRCDTNPTIQITTSANDTALRYVKYIQSVDAAMRDRAKNALAAIRNAKENSNG